MGFARFGHLTPFMIFRANGIWHASSEKQMRLVCKVGEKVIRQFSEKLQLCETKKKKGEKTRAVFLRKKDLGFQLSAL